MATMQKQGDQDKMQGQGQKQGGQTGQSGDVGSPISNDAYNIISALHNKLEGLEAYRKYAKDGDSEIWRELSSADRQCVETLVGELEKMVQEGRFRMGASKTGGGGGGGGKA